MIRIQNLFSSAALAALGTLCLTAPAQAATLAPLAYWLDGGNGGLVCDAGGPYTLECSRDALVVQLDGTGSTGATTHFWSTNYPGAVFGDANAASTTMTFTPNVGGGCGQDLFVMLTVGNGNQTRSCSALVRVRDTQAPVLECPELAKITCGGDESPQNLGIATATDNCDDQVTVTYTDHFEYQDCRAERLNYSIHRFWRAVDNCGNYTSCEQEIHVVKDVIEIDVLPGECPNVLTVGATASTLVQVAILGGPNFDVTNVDLSSVRIYGEHCDGGPVVPVNASVADVGTPFQGDKSNCDCHTAAGDGFPDLLLSFRKRNLFTRLGLPNLPSGATKRVVLVGRLANDCNFIGTDCVVVP